MSEHNLNTIIIIRKQPNTKHSKLAYYVWTKSQQINNKKQVNTKTHNYA